MKLDHGSAALKIESSEQFETAGFNIRASAIAFNVLSSGLYQDKITAVIRELSTNAYDGHKLAEFGVRAPNGTWEVAPKPGQTKVPFKVELPTTWNPVFLIRDYGVGLSHDGVMKLYTTYFGSTKSDSNDFVGALGLGSKSPFSLSSSFLVTSFYNGTKRTYTAMIGENGFPNIVKMGEERTSEQNGLQVQVTVDPNQCQMFKDRAAKVYAFFHTKPDIPSLSIPTVEYDQKTDKWGIRKNLLHVPAGVIMGQICYPITLSAIEGKVKPHIFALLKQHANKIDLFCNIGDVEFQSSREALSYTAKTFKFFEDALDSFYQEILDTVSKKINSEHTLIDKIRVVRGLDQLTKLILEESLRNGTFKHKGRAIDFNTTSLIGECKNGVLSDVVVTKTMIPSLYASQPPREHVKVVPNHKFRVLSGYDGSHGGRDHWYAGFDQKNDQVKYSFPIPTNNKSICIIHNDTGVALFKIKDHICNGQKSVAPGYAPTLPRYDYYYLVDKKYPEVAKFITDLYEYTGYEKVSDWNISDVDEQQVLKYVRGFTPKAATKNWYGNYEINVSDCFSKVDSVANLKKFKYYVCTVKNAHSIEYPLDDTKTMQSTDFNDMMSSLKELGVFDESVAVVGKTNLKLFKELAPHVKPLGDMLKAKTWASISKTKQEEISALVFRSKMPDNKKLQSGTHDELIADHKHFLTLISKSQRIDPAIRTWAATSIVEYEASSKITYDKLGSKDKRQLSKLVVTWLGDKFAKDVIDFQSYIAKTKQLEDTVKTIFPAFRLVEKLYYKNQNYRYYKFDPETVQIIEDLLINDTGSIKAHLNI